MDMNIDVAKVLIPIAGPIIAAFSAIGGALAGRFWDAMREKKQQRNLIVIRYLSHLQTTSQMLGERLNNLLYEGGHGLMSPDYFHLTTLYVLACPLAIERILTLEGVYPQIRMYNKYLYSRITKMSLDRKLTNFHFHRYDRLALAECAMMRENSGLRLATIFEFRQQYDMAHSKHYEWIESAILFTDLIEKKDKFNRMNEIIDFLKDVDRELYSHTGIPLSRISEQEIGATEPH
jgi:hypothetical protein